ncbi:NAD(P)H-hydrate dehydratase [Rhodocyclus tenuis]|uniref:Bifunctional NAD(P)H-hydrate repair enzyme n=1 Tax=Rhodocyclus tenuis TaxID=1066 RepID=A0A840GCX1_RHOTE|nr:NAD(P)H-hydrate dehydratase [Rhodocyclus tenuis]MBB4248478.1 hydroxyethylthiazole kinase-like uncharacterized protein yjeF [Rhodocyclus tenuis]
MPNPRLTPLPPAVPLLEIAALRAIECDAAHLPLMQRAGAAAATLAATLCTDEGSVLVLAGPGANGGDAFVTASRLRELFFDLTLVFTGDVARLPGDAAAACRDFVAAGGEVSPHIPAGKRWSLIVDGLFGIGLSRAIGGDAAALVAAANTLAARDGCPLLALDCPSGLDAASGIVAGPAIRATHTLTFIAAKPGLFTGDGPDHCGSISVATLGLEAAVARGARGRILARPEFAVQLRPRLRNTHKGSFGNAGIVGGAPGMLGAALLAGRAAQKLGAGRVFVGLLDEKAPGVDATQPELMLRPPASVLAGPLDALLCGPGLGDSEAARSLLASALALPVPLLLDADALNRIAADSVLQVALAARPAPSLLTPHPAEAARLLGSTVASVQADRVAAAQAIARRYAAGVVLKGCGSVIAFADGRWLINTTGNPGMASAGMGDVLAGIVVALLTQGWSADEALLAGVHLHGAAADALAASDIGPIGLTAGETIDAARRLLNAWCAAT